MPTTRVPVNPDLLRWARERSGIAHETLVKRFGKLPEWEAGRTRPTIKQLQAFARAVHVSFGCFFLKRPPDESVPIPDFRTVASKEVSQPSPNLLDTIYACQERQVWYEEFLRASGRLPLDFVGSVTVDTPPETVAEEMREALDFDLAARRKCGTWTDALRVFIREIEEAGVLVMVSGVVRNNSHRLLDPDEFRGFALSDPLAPLIFVNGRDSKAAQMFTLAHELAHVWLGASALSNHGVAPRPGCRPEEVWCNSVAAELLVPSAVLRSDLLSDESLQEALSRLTRAFKVSSLVVLRRLFDVDWIDHRRFDAEWRRESERLRDLGRSGSGGNFYRTATSRASRRFARALVVSTLEGRTLYRDAFRMLGIEKSSTFDKLVRELGISA